jgi:hypothetical protein
MARSWKSISLVTVVAAAGCGSSSAGNQPGTDSGAPDVGSMDSAADAESPDVASEAAAHDGASESGVHDGAAEGSTSDAGGHAVPARIEGYWYWGYAGPTIAATQSNAPAANYMSWFAATGTGAKDGHLTFSGVGTPSATDIAAWKAAGKFIAFTIGGGASDVGQPVELDLNTTAQEANLYADVVSAVGTYGFQGLDVDMESDSGQWTTTQMCKLFADLKAHFGADFSVEIDPAPYQLRSGGVYASLYAACGADIDLVSPQWYSECNQSDAWFENTFIGPDLATFTGTIGIPSTKILIGASDNSGDCGAPGGPSTYCTAYANWTSANPAKPLRGLIWFQTESDQAEATPWIYGSTAKTCLGL